MAWLADLFDKNFPNAALAQKSDELEKIIPVSVGKNILDNCTFTELQWVGVPGQVAVGDQLTSALKLVFALAETKLFQVLGFPATLLPALATLYSL